MYAKISATEREFVQQGAAMNCRNDGRSALDVRNISVEDLVFPHLNGSSKVSVGYGTDVICSIKFEVCDAVPSSSLKDLIDITFEISHSCNVRMDERRLQDHGSSAAEIVKNILIQSASIDMEILVIVPGRYNWMMHIDIVALQIDGPLIDAASIAIISALRTTRIPKARGIIGESGKEEDFEVSGDLGEALAVSYDRVPLFLTIGKIGGALLIDPTAHELECVESQLVVAVDRRDVCCGLQKIMGGTFTLEEAATAIQIATAAAKSIFLCLDEGHDCASSSFDFPEIPPPRIGLLA